MVKQDQIFDLTDCTVLIMCGVIRNYYFFRTEIERIKRKEDDSSLGKHNQYQRLQRYNSRRATRVLWWRILPWALTYTYVSRM